MVLIHKIKENSKEKLSSFTFKRKKMQFCFSKSHSVHLMSLCTKKKKFHYEIETEIVFINSNINCFMKKRKSVEFKSKINSLC